MKKEMRYLFLLVGLLMTTTVSADIRVFCKAPGRKLTGLFHKINAYQTILLIRHNTHQIIIHIRP